jgi:hypothetical protein
MPGPKPGALPAWRPPSAFEFKGSGPALLPIRQLKLTAGETPCGRSAGDSRAIQSIRTEPPRDRTAQLSRRTCPDFDFSSQCAGNAMLLMRFFAVNASPSRPCTAPLRLLDFRLPAVRFIIGFAVHGRRRNYRCERRTPADLDRRAFGRVGRFKHAKDRAAAARHLRRAGAQIFK